MSPNPPIMDSKSICMCTECKRMVQRTKMQMGFASGATKLLCPECYLRNKKDDLIIKTIVEDNDNLDPEMKELKRYLEDKGLI